MKTFSTILFLAVVATSVTAQPSPPAPVAEIPRRAARATGLTNTTPSLANAAANAPITAAAAAANPRPARVAPTPPSIGPRTATPIAPGLTPPPGLAPTLPAPGPGAVNPVAAAPTINVPLAGTTNPDEEVFPAGLIKFQDADLIQVLDFYQELTGKTIVRPASLPAAKISIKSQTALTRTEAIQALDTILAMNQITMIPQGTKFMKAVPQAGASQEGAQFNTQASSNLTETTRFQTRILKLTNALPREVAPALQPLSKMPNSILAIDSAGILVLRDYEENIKRMLELLEQIDVLPQQEYEPVVIPIKYALAADIAQVLSTLTAGGGGATTVGRNQTRTGLSSAGGGGGLGGGGLGGAGGGFGGAGGYPGAAGYNPANPNGGIGGGGGGGGGLSGGSAGRSSFASRLQSIVNRASGSGDIVVLGQTKIIADERTNSLLIFAARQDLISISNIINKLDVVLAQVIIEAVIIEVNLGDSYDLGFNYNQGQNPKKDHRFGSTTFGPTGGGSTTDTNNTTGAASGINNVLQYMKTVDKWDFNATVTAAASDSRARILSRPRIQTSHAVEANLFVGRTRPYPTGSSAGSIYGGSYNSIQQLQIGITLSVLPLINPDGLVVMDIRQRVQDVGKEIEIQNVGTVPETIDREANAKVAVRDGESVMLGGFISSNINDSKSGVPLLKDIPILGALFRSTHKVNDRVELMVLIRPTVLPTPEIAAIVADREKSRLPDVSKAEREEVEEMTKRQSEAKKDLLRREGLLQ